MPIELKGDFIKKENCTLFVAKDDNNKFINFFAELAYIFDEFK